MDHLDLLEAEAIHIFREISWQFNRPVLLFSGGKNSTVLIKYKNTNTNDCVKV